VGVTPSHQANGELVLVGAGHAHVEVLRRGPELLSAVGITVIARHDRAWYSGMMPGCVAGAYAVRQGPVLARNLAASFAGRPLRTYRPQGHFLALLMTGDGAAIASRPRLTWHGR